MDNKHVGFEINLKENEKLVFVPMAKELKENFEKRTKNKKTANDFLREFLIREENYDKAIEQIEEHIELVLPSDIKEQCDFCKGISDEEQDKACSKYILQMKLTFFVAIHEYVSIIMRHKHIYENKKALFDVTINFFSCLYFVKGKGVMYFDLDKIRRFTLNAGFLSLSEMFSTMEKKTRLNILNRTIHDIDDKIIENETLETEDENYLELQKRFFESKLRYYKDVIFINDINSNSEPKNGKKGKRKEVTIPMYALYYFYLQGSGDFGYFENHPEGKLQAISELIQEEKLNTTTKYFQKVYNRIAHHTTNRVARNQIANIDFVANTMLKDFPKAKENALSELKQAQTKNR